MPGRLAIDFGTSNTVVALWDAERKGGRSIPLGSFSRLERYDNFEFHSTPSLIHYHSDGEGARVSVGAQLFAANGLLTHPHTFRLMKTYVAQGMLLARNVGNRRIDFSRAASDFLGQVLLAAGSYCNLSEEEVAFTVPVEAFEHYQKWLEEAATNAGVGVCRFIDEASAAALGYAARLRTGAAFIVFDFGGGTADVSVVKLDENQGGERRCRALGKAGAQVGGSSIDLWLARLVIERSKMPEAESLRLMPLLLLEAERVKKALSDGESETFTCMNPDTGQVVQEDISRSQFEDLLDKNGLYNKLNTILDLAEAQARERGYARDSFQACLMIGGSSLIPSVRRLLRARYGELVRCERPFDAVAVGAAAWVAGTDFDDRIRHEYALRAFDRATGQYIFKTIVPAGTSYPCAIMDPANPQRQLVLTIKAANEEQTRLGIEIWEVSHRASAPTGGEGFDLVFDAMGGAHYSKREDVEQITRRPIGSKSFIEANPPAKKGDPRFVATFSINSQKYICITVRDNRTGRTLKRDEPLVKLT